MQEHRNNTVLLFRWMLTSVRRSHTSTRCNLPSDFTFGHILECMLSYTMYRKVLNILCRYCLLFLICVCFHPFPQSAFFHFRFTRIMLSYSSPAALGILVPYRTYLCTHSFCRTSSFIV